MKMPEGRFSSLLIETLSAVATVKTIDRAIGTMLWHNLPWHRRAWLRVRRRKAATITAFAQQWTGTIPRLFQA